MSDRQGTERGHDTRPGIDSQNMEQRCMVARVIAQSHGAPLGFFDEEVQLGFDAMAQRVLRDLAALMEQEVPDVSR